MRHENRKKPHILYFLQSMVPTPAEKADAELYGAVSFRNASFIDAANPIEPNDGVAGSVPESYADCKGAVKIGQQFAPVAPLAPAPAAPIKPLAQTARVNRTAQTAPKPPPKPWGQP